jgi:hypothetical protein
MLLRLGKPRWQADSITGCQSPPIMHPKRARNAGLVFFRNDGATLFYLIVEEIWHRKGF